MKTYPYIVINKGNMKELFTFSLKDSVASFMYKRNGNLRDFNSVIIIKDEQTIIDTSSMIGVGGEYRTILSKFKELL